MTEPTTEIVKARVPIEIADALKAAADANERTVSAEIRLALRAHLADAEPERQAA